MNEDGFDYQGDFFPWHVSDVGKDLRLIDHFTAMPVSEFFSSVQDSFDNGRGPILLALIATSVRHSRPEWSVERISRMVDAMSLSDVEFIESGEGGDEEPPPSAGEQPADKLENPLTSSDEQNGSPESTTPEPSSGSPD